MLFFELFFFFLDFWVFCLFVCCFLFFSPKYVYALTWNSMFDLLRCYSLLPAIMPDHSLLLDVLSDIHSMSFSYSAWGACMPSGSNSLSLKQRGKTGNFFCQQKICLLQSHPQKLHVTYQKVGNHSKETIFFFKYTSVNCHNCAVVSVQHWLLINSEYCCNWFWSQVKDASFLKPAGELKIKEVFSFVLLKFRLHFGHFEGCSSYNSCNYFC